MTSDRNSIYELSHEQTNKTGGKKELYMGLGSVTSVNRLAIVNINLCLHRSPNNEGLMRERTSELV